MVDKQDKWNPNLMYFIYFRSKNLWIDGYNVGDDLWKTYSYRGLDFNTDPTLAQDLSHTRIPYEKGKDNDLEFFKPRKLPVKFLTFPVGFCSSSSDMVLQVTGSWQPLQLAAKPPIIQFYVNKTTDLFFWEFKAGSKKENHMYELWSRTNKQNNTNLMVNLTEMQRDPIPTQFNITISCKQFPVFNVKLNFWDNSTGDPNAISRDTANWDADITVDNNVNPDVTEYVTIDGAMEVEYAGFTRKECMSLTSTGLIETKRGDECDVNSDILCEHQTCFTIEGSQCVFPFTYKDVVYHNCSSVDVYLPWCATSKIVFY